MWQPLLMLGVVLSAASLLEEPSSSSPARLGSEPKEPHQCADDRESKFTSSGLLQDARLTSKVEDVLREFGGTEGRPAEGAQLEERASADAAEHGAARGELAGRLPPAEHRSTLAAVAARAGQSLLAAKAVLSNPDSHAPLVLTGAILLLVGLVFCVARCCQTKRPMPPSSVGPARPARAKQQPLLAPRFGTLESLSPHSARSCPEAPTSAPTSASTPSLGPPQPTDTSTQLASVESTQLQVASPPGSVSGTPHLCPALVVPEGSVCKLRVPMESPSSANGNTVVIKGACGVPIFKAFYSFRPSAGFGRGRQKHGLDRIALLSATSDVVYAYCRRAEDGEPGLQICHHYGAPFARLRASGPAPAPGNCYSVLTVNGSQVHFESDRQGFQLKGIDEYGCLMAISEVDGAHRSLRIGPMVDAGLILLAMLGMDMLVQMSS